METAQHNLSFTDLAQAQAYAQAHCLPEKAVGYTVRGAELLVFDHMLGGVAGVQVVSGGLEVGETPEQAALRDANGQTGRSGFGSSAALSSLVWLNSEHAQREMRRFVYLTAPAGLPDTWPHPANRCLFSFRCEPLHAPGLDSEGERAASRRKGRGSCTRGVSFLH
ncbi:NUDIX hydrolase [Deinococcus sp.]|uniref:NUDIX hydrolase n=1 Tax=Deinococcus sp. TaxID=47478 RepID=UPI0025C141C4|nr:NUDIX hydrolase [Deinococcus sp.]